MKKACDFSDPELENLELEDSELEECDSGESVDESELLDDVESIDSYESLDYEGDSAELDISDIDSDTFSYSNSEFTEDVVDSDAEFDYSSSWNEDQEEDNEHSDAEYDYLSSLNEDEEQDDEHPDDVALELSPITNNIRPNPVSDAAARQFLSNWLLEYRVERNAVNPLLRFLKQVFPRLPIDTRTLVNTPKNREVIDIPPGKYVHLGLKTSIDLLLGAIDIKNLPESIKLTFNIDGVPIAKSSTVGFWLILGRIDNILLLRKSIFLVGAYHGYKKPSCFNAFLERFVNELLDIINSYIHRNKDLDVEVFEIICDSPALANVKYIKSHNGYYGCSKCVQRGLRINNRTTFLQNNCPLRTNSNFRNRENPEHHNGDSNFEDIGGIDMVQSFPLDPLHLIYLGVMKRFLRIWMFDEEGCQIDPNTLNGISEKLKQIAQAQPSEFQRKCRSLDDIGYYKGHEFRTFLLYSGPVVLKDMLTPEKYNHFLLLHVAISILNNSRYCQKFNSLAECLLKVFVAELYAPHHIVYCVHNLIHVPADVKKYGDLNEYAAFPFESYMFQIKRLIRKHNLQLPELCNRMEERKTLGFFQLHSEPAFPLFKKKAIVNGKRVFREVCLPDFKLNVRDGNNWLLTDKLEIVRFQHVEVLNGMWCVYGYERKHKTDFYSIPVKSSKIQIYRSFIKEEESCFH